MLQPAFARETAKIKGWQENVTDVPLFSAQSEIGSPRQLGKKINHMDR